MADEETQLVAFFRSLVDDEVERLIIDLVGKGLEPTKIVEILLSKGASSE